MVNIREKKARQELEKARWWLEREPANVRYIEAVARLLRWLEEPGATDYFRRAAADRLKLVHRTSQKRLVQDPKTLFATGNYYRLAGDHEEARRYLEWAYSELRKSVPGALSTDQNLARFIECGYLLGRYAEIEAVDREKGSARGMAELARARLAGDARAAAALAKKVGEVLRESRMGPGSVGLPLSGWDFYELALQAVEELGGVGEAEGEQAPEPGEPEPRTGVRPPERRRFTREEVVAIIEEALETGEEVDLADADLSGVDLSGLVAWQVLFVGADLSGADLSGSDFRESHFDDAALPGADLRALLRETSFSDADLSSADLRRTDLGWAVLIRAKLEGADLSGAELLETNLQDANLRNAKLTGAEFQETDFSGADLSNADLAGLDLSGTEFVGARLRGTNLSGADLSNADFSEADLTGANLRRAKFAGADFEGAIMDDVLR